MLFFSTTALYTKAIISPPIVPSKNPHIAPIIPPKNEGVKPIYIDDITSTNFIPQPNMDVQPTNSIANPQEKVTNGFGWVLVSTLK